MLYDVGIRVEKTIAVGKYVVFDVVLDNGKKAIARIPQSCIKLINEEKCRRDSRDLELELENILRIKSDKIVKHIKLINMSEYNISIREYIEKTLRDLINNKELTFTRIIEISRDVALALNDIHTAGFVFADLKPENVGINIDGKAILLDLDSLTKPYTKPRFITYSYAPPEYLRDGIVVYESDVYQLALLIHEMIHGELLNPVLHQGFSHIENDELSDLLKRMLNPIPFLRPELLDIVNELESILKN